MMRMTILLSLIAAALRYSGHLVSVIDEPLAQAGNSERAGADRLGGVGGRALRLDDRGRGLPEQERQVGLGVLQVDHHGVGCPATVICAMLRNRLLSLLVLVAAAARS